MSKMKNAIVFVLLVAGMGLVSCGDRTETKEGGGEADAASLTALPKATAHCYVDIAAEDPNTMISDTAATRLISYYSDYTGQKPRNQSASVFTFKVDAAFKSYFTNAAACNLQYIHFILAQASTANGSQMSLYISGTDDINHIFLRKGANPPTNPQTYSYYLLKNTGYYSSSHLPDVPPSTNYVTINETQPNEYHLKVDSQMALDMINLYRNAGTKDTSAYSFIFPAADFVKFINAVPDFDSLQCYLARNRQSVSLVFTGVDTAHKQILIKNPSGQLHMMEFCTPCPYCTEAGGYYGVKLEDPEKFMLLDKLKYNWNIQEKMLINERK